MSNQGRVWLITGCSSGFGTELVRAALARGDRVMATARKPEQLAALARAGGDRVRTVGLDVTDESAVEAAVRYTVGEFGRIDVVANNAGCGTLGAVEELTMADLRAAMEVMFFSAAGKAASIILAVLDSAAPPLRLALGRDAVDNIRAHHEALLADLPHWEPVSVGAAR